MDPFLRLYQTPPTTRIISSTPLSLTSASQHLTTFLALAEKHALYHPSHQLTPQGITLPQAASNTSGADKLRVLGFIAQGLEGERVETTTANELLKEMSEKMRRERSDGEFGNKRKRSDDEGHPEKDVGTDDVDAAGAESEIIHVGRVLSPMEEESQIVDMNEESHILLSPIKESKLRSKEEKLRKREERKRLKAERKK
jgi:hypothetical protein